MAAPKIMWKTVKFIIGFMLAIFLSKVFLKDMRHLEISGIYYDLIKIVLCVSGVVLCSHSFSYKHNNKANALALGNGILCILMVVEIYIQQEIIMNNQLEYEYVKCNYCIHFLETTCMLVSMYFVNETTNLKKCIGISILTIFISVFYIFRIDLRSLWGLVNFNINRDTFVVSSIMIVYITIVLFLGLNKSFILPKKQKKCVVFILHTQFIYQVFNLFYHYYRINALEKIIEIIEVLGYSMLFVFFYIQIKENMWEYEDSNLNINEKQLAEDQIEKRTLVFCSKVLKDYVKEICFHVYNLQRVSECKGLHNKKKYLNMIEKNCNRLMKLSNNIIDLNKIDVGMINPKFQLTNIVELTGVLIESIKPYLQTMNIELEFVKSYSAIYTYVDYDAIERILLNLISNAVKYNKDNGTITVYVNTRGDRVYLCVKDTGAGIPEEKLNAIFNRYERVDNKLVRSKEGSGLGLSIVKSLVEIHKGSIYMTSKENEGTLVSVALPLCVIDNVDLINKQNISKENLKNKINIEFSDINM